MIEKILPKSKQHWLECRLQDVTSTEVSALFGLSPYMTKFELWHQKKNQDVVELTDTERMAWGRRFETPIALAIADQRGLKIEHMPEYLRDPVRRIGSSFDYAVLETIPCQVSTQDGRAFEEELTLPRGILEIKNVDGFVFRNQWVLDGKELTEAPAHIELQVQHQLLVTDRDYAYIGALVGGNELHVLRRVRNDNICDKIVAEVAKFWQSIYDNKCPEPDFERDAAFISEIYGYAEVGKVKNAEDFEGIESLVADYQTAAKLAKEADSAKAQAKAQLLMKIGDTEKVVGEEFSISAGMIAGATISYERKAYRNFRVTKKKKKEPKNDSSTN